MSIQEEITERLTTAFSPRVLDVVDDSEAHRGHGGWREGGETHFNVKIKADGFSGLSRIARHRAVHEALTPELVGRIHALSLDISS